MMNYCVKCIHTGKIHYTGSYADCKAYIAEITNGEHQESDWRAFVIRAAL